MSADRKYKLRYTNARAWGEPIRLLFAYKGIEYEDIRLEKGDCYSCKPEHMIWDPAQPEPILEEGRNVLGHYNVITRYLGRKFGLAGDREAEAAECEQTVELLNDLRHLAKLCWVEPPFGRPAVDCFGKKGELRAELVDTVFPTYFRVWEEQVRRNEGVLVGRRYSYADFSIATRLQSWTTDYGPTILEGFPNLAAHSEALFRHPKIKAWLDKRPQTEF